MNIGIDILKSIAFKFPEGIDVAVKAALKTG